MTDAVALSLADWDWLIDYYASEPALLHAPITEAAAHFDVDWDGELWAGKVLCGLESESWDIPGLFSRMGGRDRCPQCCVLLGYPVGAGSPKNDMDCRRLMGAAE